jgi:hypothetical protein
VKYPGPRHLGFRVHRQRPAVAGLESAAEAAEAAEGLISQG